MREGPRGRKGQRVWTWKSAGAKAPFAVEGPGTRDEARDAIEETVARSAAGIHAAKELARSGRPGGQKTFLAAQRGVAKETRLLQRRRPGGVDEVRGELRITLESAPGARDVEYAFRPGGAEGGAVTVRRSAVAAEGRGLGVGLEQPPKVEAALAERVLDARAVGRMDAARAAGGGGVPQQVTNV